MNEIEPTPIEEPPTTEASVQPMPRIEDDPAPGADARGPLNDLLGRFEDCLLAFREQLDANADSASRTRREDTERAEQARVRETLLERIEASRPAFRIQLLRPLVERLVGAIDLVSGWTSNPSPSAETLSERMTLVESQLRDILTTQGIEAVSPKTGEVFDRRFHYVVETRPTGDANQHERIAGVIQQGYVYLTIHEKTAAVIPTVIRPAKVVMWKHDPATVVPSREPIQDAPPSPPAESTLELSIHSNPQG